MLLISELPTDPGFFWARWIRAHPGTKDGPIADNEEWIIVQVFENAEPGNPEHLLVLVPGVEMAQTLDDFVWAGGPIRFETDVAAGLAGH